MPQSSLLQKPGQQTILQTYRSSRRSFDLGFQGYQSVLKSRGTQQSAAKYNNTSRIEEDKQRAEALELEIKKAFEELAAANRA